MQMHNQIAYMGKLQITETPFVHVCNWPQQMVKYSRSPCAQLTCGMKIIDKKEKRIKNCIINAVMKIDTLFVHGNHTRKI